MLTTSYIHMNPVKSLIVEQPEKYKWSSFNDFLVDRKNDIIYTNFILEVFGNKNNFSEQNIKLYKEKVSKGLFDT